MAKAGWVRRKATLDERAEMLVRFAKVMLRRPFGIRDAKCLLQNIEPYGPDFLHEFPTNGGKRMAKKAKKAAKAKAVTKAAPKKVAKTRGR